MLIGNTAGTSLYIVLQKKYIFLKRDSRWRDYPVTVTAWAYMFGAVFMAISTPGVNLFSECHGDNPWNFPGSAIYALIYAVVIASTINYLLIAWANMIVPSTLVVSFWPLQVMNALFLIVEVCYFLIFLLLYSFSSPPFILTLNNLLA